MSMAKDMFKEKEELQTRLLKYEINEIFEDVVEISGVKVLIKSFKNKNIEELKEIVDRGKEKLQSGIIVLGSDNGKAIFVAGVTKDTTSSIKAGDIVKIAAQAAGGNGGGRPDFAQAGGKDGSAVEAALKKAEEFIKKEME